MRNMDLAENRQDQHINFSNNMVVDQNPNRLEPGQGPSHQMAEHAMLEQNRALAHQMAQQNQVMAQQLAAMNAQMQQLQQQVEADRIEKRALEQSNNTPQKLQRQCKTPK